MPTSWTKAKKRCTVKGMTRDGNNGTSDSILTGPVWRSLLSFFFPILLGTFFQQLYNTVDAVIVGQFLGKAALAAVSGGSGVYVNLLVGFFLGVSSGSTIIISQFYGAKREHELSRAVHTAMALSVWAGVFMSVAGVFASAPAMKAISTPNDIFSLSVTYLQIYFAGALPMFVYNVGSGILRALGDSKSPFIILVAGCAANIFLDLLFVAVFRFSVAGAAWATVISQILCALLTLAKLMRQKNRYARLFIGKIRFTAHLLARMSAIGLPAGVQASLYTVSNLIIQSSINSFGTDVAAAWAAYGRLDSIFWMTVSSFGVAITTFAGQDYGAHKIDRMKKATIQGLMMAGASALLYTLIFYHFGQYIFLLFTRDAAVIAQGKSLLHFLPIFFIAYVPIEMLSGTIRSTGETLKPMIITMLGVCVLRVAWIFAAVPLRNTLLTVVACYPITWTATAIAFFIYYCRGKWLTGKTPLPDVSHR